MKQATIFISLLAFILNAPPARAAGSGALALQEAFVELSAKSKPAVVNISVVQEQRVQVQAPDFFFGDPEDMMRQFMEGGRPRMYRYRSQGTGSGFLIDPKGYIITNDHVVGGATEIRAALAYAGGKDKIYPAKVVGRDPSLDLAVVKIQAKSGEEFPSLKFADKPPRVGEWAVAIGSPFALEQTVTAGIISAQRQSLIIEGRRYADMIQTDAAINRGNSGGPLLNLNGEVIGVNTAIYSPNGASAGIGFAIPASQVKTVLGYLLAGKKMPRGWLGIETAPVDEVMKRRFALPSADGALVNKVFQGSPAEKAGLRRGDVIRSLNGTTVSTPDDLINAASKLPSGKKVAVTAYRKGTPIELAMTLGERPGWADGQGGRAPEGAPEEEAPEKDEETATFTWHGMAFASRQQGVVVTQISPNSPFVGSLMPGDVVRGVNDIETTDLDQLRAAVKRVKVSEGVFFDIVRQGQPLYLSVKP